MTAINLGLLLATAISAVAMWLSLKTQRGTSTVEELHRQNDTLTKANAALRNRLNELEDQNLRLMKKLLKENGNT